MSAVDFRGQRFEVLLVVDPPMALVSLGGAVQGCAEIVDGRVVANLSADGSSTVSARTVAEVACRCGFAIGFPIAERGT